ncbi:MAG: SWIM zinc finger family protein [Clostridia bacterium]
MGLINMASGSSTWRGLDYYEEKKVSDLKEISQHQYEAIVKGSNHKKYNVFMDIEHPKKSKCNCPHAKDRNIICKHIVALYFTVFPNEVDRFLKEVEEEQKEYEKYEKELYKKVAKDMNAMSKSELKEALTYVLNISPDWVYDSFVRDIIEDE